MIGEKRKIQSTINKELKRKIKKIKKKIQELYKIKRHLITKLMEVVEKIPKNTKSEKGKEKAELSFQLDNKNLSSSTVKGTEGQKEIKDTKLSTKKEKSAKPRTRVSAKKTIEGLKTNDNKSIENDDNVKNTKMGKKGWWDR